MTFLFKNNKHLIITLFFLTLSLVLMACQFTEVPLYTTDDVLESISLGYAQNDDENGVTQDLYLVDYLEAYPLANITWESANPDVISHQGDVTRPYENTQVILILTVRVGSVSRQRLFEVTIKGTSTETEDQLQVNLIRESIDIIYFEGDDKDTVTQSLILTTNAADDTSVIISWQSSDLSIVSHEGVVSRPLIDTEVTLTVSISKNEITEEKHFEITVLGTLIISTYTIEIYHETFETAIYELIKQTSLPSYVEDVIEIEIDTVDGFIVNDELTKSRGIVDESGLLLKIYYDRLVYRIEFYDPDVLIGYEDVLFGGQLQELPPLTKEGYDFRGWSKSIDGAKFDINTPIDASFTLYPLWRVETSYLPYYDDLSDATGDDLLEELRNILNQGVTIQTYGDARYILQESDEDPNIPGNIILVYRGTSVTGTWDFGATWNREHVWPQSLLGISTNNSSTHVGADLHNLKPANPSENSSRSNKYFDWTTTSSSYEPRDEVKGDVARILFYMVAMYDYLELINSTPTTYKMAMLNTLLAWHEQDPPDDFERNRNEIIYAYQGNRNPFIDHPELVDLIWGEIIEEQTKDNQGTILLMNPIIIERKKQSILI